MKTHIAPVTAGSPNDLFDSFDHALGGVSAANALFLGGFAYATLAGAQHFVSHTATGKSWLPIAKRFVIGIHHGITEPSALEFLRSVHKSEVRIFIPGNKLNIDALSATPLFHPKVLALVNSHTGRLTFLQAGSANLTASAISDAPKNYELAIALRAGGKASLHSTLTFTKWWSKIWSYSRDVDRSLIERYADVRLKVLERNPILRHAAGPPSNIGAAEYCFVEVGAASGPPGLRHQVEFPESLAAFFGKPVSRRRDLTLCRNGVTWNGRPLSYKVTTYGVAIWRLGMPTQNSGGEPIAQRAIRFKRTNDSHTFEFEIADTQSQAFVSWEKAANTLGHLGSTHGERPRTYGFY
ncbi:MAG: hypothetical protein JW395_3897 [Nitrospira sp.]|nr:hypothetical protein [Nitrospira sp.]